MITVEVPSQFSHNEYMLLYTEDPEYEQTGTDQVDNDCCTWVCTVCPPLSSYILQKLLFSYPYSGYLLVQLLGHAYVLNHRQL